MNAELGTRRLKLCDRTVQAARASSPTAVHLVVARGFGPAWSPDGVKLTFSIANSYGSYLYVADRDGGNTVRLVADKGDDMYEPDWQPLH
jgi:Tol biopolymer transport system component